MTFTRSTRTALAALAFAAGTGAGITTLTTSADAEDRTIRASGPTFVHGAGFEDVDAEVTAVTTANGTTIVTLHLGDLPSAVRGTTLGAHVHTGACGTAAGASGPHYANPDAPAGTPLHDREIWLDVDVNEAGRARAVATADWVITPGAARSVVVHANPTNHADGTAGARLFCTDVPFGGTE